MLFRGKRIISRVYNIDNNDVSDHLLLDCASAMDHLQGPSIKCVCDMAKNDPIASLFWNHRIKATGDFGNR
jgi:hypothetical protein